MTLPELRAALAAAPGHADLAGADLHGLDLGGLDLSGARLRRANLAGARLVKTKLVGADLTEARLAGADLAFAWIMRADFTRADLRRVTMRSMVTSYGMQNTPETAARFVGADLSGGHMTVHFSFDDLRGAKFVQADLAPVMMNQSMGLLRTEFDGAKLQGADFTRAALAHLTFRYAHLEGARFVGADVSHADFSGAYLQGADFAGANTAGAIGLDLPR
jgi:uncharacterized protein YjbI with pentapeptide repeats